MRFPLIAATIIVAAAPVAGRDLTDWQRETWLEIGMILSAGEQDAMLSVQTQGELEFWVSDFWLQKDPDPTTARNERRDEHYKRLAAARMQYPGEGGFGLDKRGLDLVLVGQPDERIFQDDWFDETGHHPAREIWVWLEPSMRATYWDWNLDGEYERAGDELPSTRPDVERRISQALQSEDDTEQAGRFLTDLRIENPLVYQDLVRRLTEGEVEGLMEARAEARLATLLQPKLERMEGRFHQVVKKREDTYRHDFKADALWAIFAVDCFRGSGGKTRVEISHQVRAADLGFRWDFDRRAYLTTLKRRVVFFDERNARIAANDERIPISAESRTDSRSALLLPGLSVHELPPGDYRFALYLEDEGSGRLQVFESEVSVPALAAAGLHLSDITFATALGEGSEPAIFDKGGWIVHPHPMRSFAYGSVLHLYFEIYGLVADWTGLNDYKVTYRIRRLHPDVEGGWLWTRERVVDPEVSSTFRDRHGSESARHPLSISTDGFAEDSYLVEISVHDRLGGETATGSARFSILPPNLVR